MKLQEMALEELKEEVLEAIEGKSDDEKKLKYSEINLKLIGTSPDVVIVDHVKCGMLRFSLIAAHVS